MGKSLGRSAQWGYRGIILLLVLSLGSVAHAQYVPIPNFTGTLAGQQFRNALNNKLSGTDTNGISPQLVHLYFYQLPSTVENGQMYYVNDGTPGPTCAGSGGGAVAIGINNVWACLPSNAANAPAPTSVTCAHKTTSTGNGTFVSNATNSYGAFTTPNTTTDSDNCQITFSTPMALAPSCVWGATNADGSIGMQAVSAGTTTTTATVDFASAGSTTVGGLLTISYACGIFAPAAASGEVPIVPLSGLPATVTNGQSYYTTNGAPGTPCVSGGSGAIATGINGQWSCHPTTGAVNPASYSGSDLWAQINSALASTACTHGCTIDASQYANQALTISSAPLVISTPGVRLKLPAGANISFTSAATGAWANGLIQLTNTGAADPNYLSGVEITCGDGNQGAGYRNSEASPTTTGNSCALVVEPSSGSMPVVEATNHPVNNVYIHDLTIIGNQHVTHGIYVAAGFGENWRVDHNTFYSANGINGTSSPTGDAVYFTGSTGGYDFDHTEVNGNLISGWANGIALDGTGASEEGLRVTNNEVLYTTGYALYGFNLASPVVESNTFSQLHPASAGQANVFLSGLGRSPTVVANTWDDTNMSGTSGVVDFQNSSSSYAPTGGLIAGNVFNGGIGQASTDDPDKAILIPSTQLGMEIDGNYLSNYGCGTSIASGGLASYAGNYWTAGNGSGTEACSGTVLTFIVEALSNACKGTQALTSGSPSTATVSNSCITTSCVPTCTDESAANAIKCVPSSGNLVLTGPNTVTDTIGWACQ